MGQGRIVASNEECFQVAVPDMVDAHGQRKQGKNAIRQSGKVNKLFAYPASSKGLFEFACQFLFE